MYQNYKDRKFLIKKNKCTRRPLKIVGLSICSLLENTHLYTINISLFEKLFMQERVGRELILSTACKVGFLYKDCQPEMEIF